MGGREVAMLRQEVDELRRRLADTQRQYDAEVMEQQKVRNHHRQGCICTRTQMQIVDTS